MKFTYLAVATYSLYKTQKESFVNKITNTMTYASHVLLLAPDYTVAIAGGISAAVVVIIVVIVVVFLLRRRQAAYVP